ncbi:type VI secretion system tip protein TssI/VgrG [Comamonas fluminis]|uniref:type VI secretion system tip protein TssI/VgrG n=1 Tax=Comamonas fluminis TaxID=2796366 RepID=UPI001C486D3D|nr:type VI secretion system tip protein TssI/VgrG [Comamonas fluminis]
MTQLDSRLGDNRRFSFQSEAYPQDSGKFAVVRMEGSEAISRPYRFELILVSDDAQIDLDLMLARSATFSLHSPGDRPPPPNHYSGVLAEFDQLHQAGGYTFYRAVLVPRLWRLSLYRISEVYLHEQTIPEIIASVLKAGGLNSQDFQIQTQGDYRSRSFVCQYQETHLDFISRWMEKEGLYYYFSQDGKKETLQIVDSRFIHPAEAKTLHYRPVGEPDTGLDAQSVQSFIQQRKPMPAKLVLQDYNYRKADTELRVEVEVSPTGFGEVMIYGENFRDENEGKRYANIRKQELLCGERVFVGEATASGLCTGHFAELQAHYRQDFNARYLITQISHEGSQAGMLLAGLNTPYNTPYNAQQGSEAVIYQCSFKALPYCTQFRPERSTPKPRIAGTMNATVDAEGSGEYAEMDEFGQYKVQIPFDYTDKAEAKASAHVRMASPYAGSDHGMHFPLIRGSEVLLSFTDGDPDQPTIVGSVPNSSNPSVANNQNHQQNVISTRGGNQMLMQDAEGKEVIWLNSPFHKSSIGIGSVHPDGDGSIYQFTMGGSDKYTFGPNSEFSFGASNSFGIGADNSLKASIANSGSLGFSTNISTGSSIKWNLDPFSSLPFHKSKFKLLKSYSIDDGGSIKQAPAFKGQAENSFLLESMVQNADKGISDLAATRLAKFLIAVSFSTNIVAAAVFGNHIAPTKRTKKISDSIKKIQDKQKNIKNAEKTLAQAEKELEIENLQKKIADKSKKSENTVNPQKESTVDPQKENTDNPPEDQISDKEKNRDKAKEDLETIKKNNELTDQEKLDLAIYENPSTDEKKGDELPDVIKRFGTQAGINLMGQVIFQIAARNIAKKYNDWSYANQIKADNSGISLSVNTEKSPDQQFLMGSDGITYMITGDKERKEFSSIKLHGSTGEAEFVSSSLANICQYYSIYISTDIKNKYQEYIKLISEYKTAESRLKKAEDDKQSATGIAYITARNAAIKEETDLKAKKLEMIKKMNEISLLINNKEKGLFFDENSNKFSFRNGSNGLDVTNANGELYSSKKLLIHINSKPSNSFSKKGLEITEKQLELTHENTGILLTNKNLKMRIGQNSMSADYKTLSLKSNLLKLC